MLPLISLFNHPCREAFFPRQKFGEAFPSPAAVFRYFLFAMDSLARSTLCL